MRVARQQRGIRGARVRVGCIDHVDRSERQVRRRDILPGLPAVTRDVNQVGAGAHPHHSVDHRRQRQRQNRSPLRRAGDAAAASGQRYGKLHARGRGEIGADDPPSLTAIVRREHVLRGRVEGPRPARRERQRRRASEAIRRRRLIQDDHLSGDAVVAPQHVIPALRVHVPLVERIRDQESVFKSAAGIPVVRADDAEVGAAGHARGARVLLRAAHVIGKVIVGGDAIELAVDEPVIRRPRLTAVDGDRGALVHAGEHPLRIRGIDPEVARIRAARRAPERGDVLTPVDRFVDGGAHDVHDVGILRIRVHLAPRAGELTRPGRPRFAAVIRSIERPISLPTSGRRPRERIHPSSVRARRDSKCADARPFLQPARAHWLPCDAAIGGFVRAAVCQQGIRDLRVAIVDVDVGGARGGIALHARPRAAAIGRPVNAALAR